MTSIEEIKRLARRLAFPPTIRTRICSADAILARSPPKWARCSAKHWSRTVPAS